MSENANSEKPIMEILKAVVKNDTKNKTVLTNAHIVNILHKEFNIIVSNMHELEADIYISVIKKFLKECPQWDEVDKTYKQMMNKNDDNYFNEVFHANYIHFKQYLQEILDYTKVLAENAVQKALEEEVAEQKVNGESDGMSVVLQVLASRNQLNQLFFREPNPELNNTIFNNTYNIPTKISCDTFPLEAILNWWGVSIGISTTNNVWIYKRETIHELQHVLVNRKLVPRYSRQKVLDQDIKINCGGILTKIDKSDLVTFIDNMSSQFTNAKCILEFIKKDLKLLPNTLFSRVTYKRYTNKYPYVRYLYKDTEIKDTDKNGISDKKFDIQLKETVCPQYKIYIGKSCGLSKNILIKCLPCNYTPSGTNLVEDFRSHFYEHHNLEPDWKCSNCNKIFSMTFLAQNWWTHRCSYSATVENING